MMTTNKEHAAALRKLADFYDATDNEQMPRNSMSLHVFSKKELIETMNAIGGRFTKEMTEHFLKLQSKRIPGVEIIILRDKVCQKVITYKCEPLLSPEDETEVMEAAAQ